MPTKKKCTGLRVVVELDLDIVYLWEPNDLMGRIRESAEELVPAISQVAKLGTSHYRGTHVEQDIKLVCSHCEDEWKPDEDGCNNCCELEVKDWDLRTKAPQV